MVGSRDGSPVLYLKVLVSLSLVKSGGMGEFRPLPRERDLPLLPLPLGGENCRNGLSDGAWIPNSRACLSSSQLVVIRAPKSALPLYLIGTNLCNYTAKRFIINHNSLLFDFVSDSWLLEF